MNRLFVFATLTFAVLAVIPAPKKIKILMAGDSTMAVKETSAYPETGWGMPFQYFWDSSVRIVNKAKNGRSTKTFLSEGLWQSLMEKASPGDYVLIQFGHNDESPEKKERYATPDTFKMLLTKFVQQTRQKGATPILITPVSRRKFDSTGKALETHTIYSALVKEVAEKEKVLCIDLDTKSRELYQNMGDEQSKLLFMQLKPGEHPNYPQGKTDNTHFTEMGARWIAEIVLQELRKLNIELTEHIVVPKTK